MSGIVIQSRVDVVAVVESRLELVTVQAVSGDDAVYTCFWPVDVTLCTRTCFSKAHAAVVCCCTVWASGQ